MDTFNPIQPPTGAPRNARRGRRAVVQREEEEVGESNSSLSQSGKEGWGRDERISRKTIIAPTTVVGVADEVLEIPDIQDFDDNRIDSVADAPFIQVQRLKINLKDLNVSSAHRGDLPGLDLSILIASCLTSLNRLEEPDEHWTDELPN